MKHSAVFLSALLASLPFAASDAPAQSPAAFTTLHRFTGGDDGGFPSSGLSRGPDGNFYGSTTGSAHDCGTIFKMTPAGALTTIYTFPVNGSQGSEPNAGLSFGPDGSLYGVTAGGGGADVYGVIFKFTPGGTFSKLASFTSSGGVPVHGAYPTSGLVRGVDGNFYGTTSGYVPLSGIGGSKGNVFRVTPDGVLSVVYTFTGGSDGANPGGNLLFGSNGAIFGTTRSGGATDEGTVFKIEPNGMESVLHPFDSSLGEGSIPWGSLVAGQDGNLYGTTTTTAFKITPGGMFTVLHPFTDTSVSRGPAGGLLLGSDGNFYGATAADHDSDVITDQGTLYRLTPTGGLTILYRFTGSDGFDPSGSLVQGSNGSFYGTASRGDGTTPDFVGSTFRLTVSGVHADFFTGGVLLGNGVYYLQFPGGNPFGYYSFLTDQNYIYHQDLGYEYVFDSDDGKAGVYLYDFKSGGFFYTSPSFPFPYLYDFSLNSVVYYYPDPSHPGRYNTDGIRYFYVFGTGQIVSK